MIDVHFCQKTGCLMGTHGEIAGSSGLDPLDNARQAYRAAMALSHARLNTARWHLEQSLLAKEDPGDAASKAKLIKDHNEMALESAARAARYALVCVHAALWMGRT